MELRIILTHILDSILPLPLYGGKDNNIMQYNNTTTKDGIIQIEETKLFGDNGYGQISNNSDRLLQFTARNNEALDRFVFLAMSADGRWQWDDNNYTDYPIATTNLISGQRDYTFALEHLEIEKVLIKDASGDWITLGTMDIHDNDYIENSDTGTPSKYDKIANSIFFDLTPNYSSTSGLKIYFKRGASYFVSTDTTKVPGFASIFHSYIPNYAGAMYAVDRQLPNAVSMYTLVTNQEKAIKEFYSARTKDEKPVLEVIKEDNH